MECEIVPGIHNLLNGWIIEDNVHGMGAGDAKVFSACSSEGIGLQDDSLPLLCSL